MTTVGGRSWTLANPICSQTRAVMGKVGSPPQKNPTENKWSTVVQLMDLH